MQRYKQKLLKMFLKGGFIEDDNKSESTCFTEIWFLCELNDLVWNKLFHIF